MVRGKVLTIGIALSCQQADNAVDQVLELSEDLIVNSRIRRVPSLDWFVHIADGDADIDTGVESRGHPLSLDWTKVLFDG